MCRFMSAIFLKNGDMIADPEHTDSHDVLARAHGLSQTSLQALRHEFIRCELVPVESYVDVESYAFTVDESEVPSWADTDFQAKAAAKMRAAVRRMLVSDTKDVLLGGCWILHGDAQVSEAVRVRIVVMLGSSSVEQMLGSSSVNQMRDSSSVKEMWDSSSVKEMRDSSSVKRMWDSSSVKQMRDSSSVEQMLGSSSVEQMLGSSSVKEMWNSSQAPKRPK